MARVFLVATALWLFLHITPATAAAQPAQIPAWRELTTQQQQVLAPVADEWDKMSAVQRKHLLGVAKHYHGMKPEEQQRVQTRLKDWAKLTPEQRKAAREKYQKLKKLPPEKRHEIKQKWKSKREAKKPQQGSTAPAKPVPSAPLASPATKPQ
jgi:hypothetical protein